MHTTFHNNELWPRWMRWSIIALGVLLLGACRGRVVDPNRGGPLARHARMMETACQPTMPCMVCPMPPEKPRPDEVLCDGGDLGSPAGVRTDGSVVGLEPTETIAAFDTLDGRTLVQPSNRVCIYAPRFGAVRRVTNAMAHAQNDFVNGARIDLSLGALDKKSRPTTTLQRLDPHAGRGVLPASFLRERQQGGEIGGGVALAVMNGDLMPYANLQVMRTGVVDNREAPLLAEAAVAAITWSHDWGVQVVIEGKQAQAAVADRQLSVMYRVEEPNHPRLRIIKLASQRSARPGEVVDFTLRYDNTGDQVIGNVMIVDNLTTRLSYVPDSAKSDRNAEFSTNANGTGSLRLRWEIAEPLQPGDGGVLTFQCHVL